MEWLKYARTNMVAISGPIPMAQSQKFADAFSIWEFKSATSCLTALRRCMELSLNVLLVRAQLLPVTNHTGRKHLC